MKKEDLIYLDHILESVTRFVEYLDGYSFEEFMENEEKQDAVIRKIEVAGEATKRLSMDLRDAYHHVPWRAIAGMRDKLIYDYFDVDLDIVWNTAQNEIPPLIPELESIIQDLEDK